ncbi:hypothetical protein [Klebsiella pneumoniae IS39]|nr:hypothetical protein [Klebsiella pneumoniae IS39]
MPGFQLRQLGGFGHRVVEVAEAVDQAVGFGIFPGPDVALGDLVDFLRRALTGVSHQGDKALIAILNAQLHQLLHFRRQRFGAGDIRQRRRGDAVGVDANRPEGIFHGVDHPKDANGAGEGAWVRHDVIRWGGDPVAAGRRHAAHRDHYRFTGGFGCRQLFTNDFRSGYAAARAVYAQNDGLNFRIEARIANLRCGGVAADVARGLFTVHDGAVGEDYRDGGTLVRRRLHVVVVIADRPVIVIRFAPAKLFGQRLFHFRGGRQLIHQLIVQRIFRRIAAHLTQAIDNALGAREELLGGDLAVGGNGVEVVLPQFANPAAIRFAGGRGHIIADEWLDGGFIGADAEDMGGDLQLIQQRFVI